MERKTSTRFLLHLKLSLISDHCTSIYSGFIEANNIEGYVPNREKYVDKKNRTDFINAVEKIEEFLSDPEVNINYITYCNFSWASVRNQSSFHFYVSIIQKFRSNSQVNQKFGNIKVKVEETTAETSLEEHHEISQTEVKQDFTNESRMQAELMSVRSQYSETFL